MSQPVEKSVIEPNAWPFGQWGSGSWTWTWCGADRPRKKGEKP